jgi:hypothetical protein
LSDDIKKYLRMIRVENAEEMSIDREKWRNIVVVAMGPIVIEYLTNIRILMLYFH